MSKPASASPTTRPLELRRAAMAAILGAVLVAPLAVLEATGAGSSDGLPLPLYASLWLLLAVVVAIAASLARHVGAAESARAGSLAIVVKIALVVGFAAVFAGMLDDQLPCILGEPNCD